jgi:hypothetical protein
MAISVGWMLGVTPPGIVAVGPNVEIRIDIDATLELRRAIVEAIASGVSIDCLADIADATLGETQELVKLLQSNGAISDLPPAALPKGIALAAALREFGAGKVPSGMIWTAEEVLVIPQSLAAHDRSRVIRAFVAGLRPEGRFHAYSLVLAGDGLVCGDHPDAAAVAERVSRVTLGPGEVAALDLVFGDVFKVQAQQIDQIGAYGAHRLGPIVEIGIPQSLDLSNEGLALFVAEIAVANIDVPTPAIARRVQGFGDPDEARLIARAEAVERYAAADLRKAELIRAAIDELKGALNPREIYALSRRQDTGVHLNEPGLWCLAETSGGSHRWVPAEAVYTSLIDSMRSLPLARCNSSGVAAHTNLEVARDKALCELVERDAFMWTWIQRVSRERIVGDALPKQALDARHRLERAGWTVHWVNLSLETLPVVLCCAVHPDHGLTLGAGCDANPAAAVVHATIEALVTSLGFATPPGRIEAS